ncbi:MAG: B12-binding domain-containing protein [Nocardioidaceae bacterium]|nr:B12-binding domain-containing protein [Nocardioidaceae bacterium]
MTAGHRPEGPSAADGISIRDASELLQIPAATIRSWERRYGVPPIGRSTGGHRRFSPADLLALRRLRDEISRGRRAADAAALVKEAAANRSPHQGLIDDFLQAAYRLDPRGADALLEHARERLGVDIAVCGVLLPAMRQIGQWWESGRCDVAHEHLATEACRAWLNRLLYTGPAPWQPETLLLTCGPRDFHTLGLESMGVLLAHRGWGCRILGARTPAGSLVTAVQGTRAAAVIMVSHLAVGRRQAVAALKAVPSSKVVLFYAGNAFISPQSRVGVPGTYLGEDLVDAAQSIADKLVAVRHA